MTRPRATATLVLLLLGGTAHAQESSGRFSVQRFHPAASQRGDYLSVESALTLPARGFEVGLVTDFTDDPFVASESGERLFSVVHGQLAVHILGAWAPLSGLQVAVDLPFYPVQTSGGEAVFGGAETIEGAGVGDLRLSPKWTFWRGRPPGGSGFSTALLANVWLPTGDRDAFQGESFRAEPRLAADWANGNGLGAALNLGFLIREEQAVENLEVRNQLTWGAAARFPLMQGRYLDTVPELQALLELNGNVTVGAEGPTAQEHPAEILLAARYRLDELFFTAGGGTGLVSGYGSPDFRAFLAVSYSRAEERLDRDGDGFPDDEDACPLDPEDFDDFQDEDGCPEADNDGDGIRDADDDCPLDPEDFDSFEDTDGCPDPDNDRDSYLDAADGCPDEAEDFDGFQDEDGCPDPDNDGDGILDVEDLCPSEPEDFDGDADFDGCPEEGGAILRHEIIEITQQIQFEYDSAVVRPESSGLLDSLAALFNDHPEITRVRIEGHASTEGTPEHNLALSQQRAEAVLAELVARGVDPARLQAEGFGATRPLVDESTPGALERNRRVEFHIVGRTE